jgi:hypothetical protein
MKRLIIVISLILLSSCVSQRMRNYVMDTEATITDISEKYNYAAVVFEAYNPIKGQVRYQMVLMRLDSFDSAYVGMCVKTDASQLQPHDYSD